MKSEGKSKSAPAAGTKRLGGADLPLGRLLPYVLLMLLGVGAVGYLAHWGLGDVQNIAQRTLNDLQDSAARQAKAARVSMGELAVRQGAEDLAEQAADYIADHPDKTLGDLQADVRFSRIADQAVGPTGRAMLIDSETLICRFHRDPAKVGLDAGALARGQRGLWEILRRARGGGSTGGYYSWTAPHGRASRKYTWVCPIEARTADGAALSVAATANVEDFLQPAAHFDRRMARSIRSAMSQLHGSSEGTRRDVMVAAAGIMIFTALLFGGMMLVIVRGRRLVDRRTAELRADIAERKRIEQQLALAGKRAQEASRAKSEFLANMSHEIRTPLNGIVGMIELLSDTEVSSAQQRYLNTITHSADTLLAVINDILDYSRIEAGRLRLETAAFDLRMMVEETAQLTAAGIRDKDVEVIARYAPDVPQRVVGDGGRVRQVLTNLVGNAAKFTRAGHIVINAEREHPGGDEIIHVAITDTGIGIPPEKLETIFDKFTQADASTTRQFGGSGLGLAICRKLVGMMRGRLWAQSVQGAGSTFHFAVPLPPADDEPARPTRAKPADLAGLRALIVDDNRINRGMLAETLAGWGIESVLADSAPAALEALAPHRRATAGFDLVILDARMPGEDGFSLAERILSEAGRPAKVVMMLTSSSTGDEAARCRRLGVEAYTSKPVRRSELREAILTALGRAGRGAGEQESSLPAGRPSRPLRILLAEDNPVNQEVGVQLLRGMGHSVLVASNGAEAVAAVSAGQFDVAFMDVQMPEMGGLEATARIREIERPGGRRMPIVALTAHAMKEDRIRCLDAGMDYYMSKPISMQRVEEVLRRVAGADVPPDRRVDGPQDRDAPPPPNPDDPQADADAIDGEALLARCMGQVEIAAKVLSRFTESVAEAPGRIDECLAAGDTVEARRLAHSLKGAAASISAEPLRAQAAEIERLCLAGAGAAARSQLMQLQLELDRCLARCQEVLEAVKQNQPETT